MFLSYRICTLAVVLLLSWLTPVEAHSSPLRPLRRIAQPSVLSLDILPRQLSFPVPNLGNRRSDLDTPVLRYDDSFRLIVSAFEQTFHLHLRPNDHLVHPAARIHYYTIGSDGKSVLSHTEPLLRESVRAYWGEVIAEQYSFIRMREDAANMFRRPHPDELGWARIMIHDQGDTDRGLAPEFEGAFSANGEIYHIMTRENYLRTKNPLDPDVSHFLDDMDSALVIWRDSDVMTPDEEHFITTGSKPTEKVVLAHSCGHDRLEYNIDPEQNPYLKPEVKTSASWFDNLPGSWNNSSLRRRDDTAGGQSMSSNFSDSIGSSAGCPTTQKILYMGVAADCTYVSQHGSQANATKQILTVWNSASSLYKNTFNVSLGIVELQVQSPICSNTTDPSVPWNVPCGTAELDNRLSLFSQWRGNKGNDAIGLWHLMSGCPSGAEVGIAWLGTLCQQTASGSSPSVVSGTAVSTSGRTEWQVVAHEIGHNFGAICASGCVSGSACCPLSTTQCNANGAFIMSPVSQAGETVFSQCTLGNICSAMRGIGAQVNTTCLVDPGQDREIISLQMCGNGIVEPGEDCDPGMNSISPCCDSATCKFKNNAVCDPNSSACCTSNCSFAPSTTVCRPSIDPQCDMSEMCTGNSSSCPSDVVAPNGQSCGLDDLKCASGHCTSVAAQCQAVGSSMGLSNACPIQGDTTCLISCQSPNATNQCIQLSSLLIDGSPCGYGGSCASGKCQSAGLLDTAKAWYIQNLQISIPVTVVTGLVFLLFLWAFIRALRRCRGSRPIAIQQPGPINARLHHERLESYPSPYDATAAWPGGSSSMHTRVPPPVHGRNTSRGWVDESLYNGPKK